MKNINLKKCFIIAEAGVNHNGSLAMAKKLVDAAKKAGADAIKFQTFTAGDLVTRSAPMAGYQKKNIGKKQTQFSMLKKLELQKSDFKELKKYCGKKNIVLLSTAHTENVVDFLNLLVPAFKVGSADLTNTLLLEKIARKGKLILLSTGMANLKEVKEAIKTIEKNGNKKIILLHCTSNYPCPLNQVNLRAMVTLRKVFNLPVGYSDHTKGFLAAVMAVAMGACVLEKHFTLDKNLPGPDHKASLEPKELKEMVAMIRNTEIALGDGIKKPTKSEEKIKKIVRKSIVTARVILKNKIITKNMIAIKRPGTGIEPKYINKIIGKKAKVDIKKDRLINWKMV